MGKRYAWLRESPYVYTDGSGHARGVGDCTCIQTTIGGLGETSEPRIDRIPPTRPPWRRRRFRELKKIIFSAPSKCSIDLFGPVANRTILKRLRARFGLNASVLDGASCSNHETAAFLRRIGQLARGNGRQTPLLERCDHCDRCFQP